MTTRKRRRLQSPPPGPSTGPPRSPPPGPSTGKRQSSVTFSAREAGPTGTGSTDTRSRDPQRSAFKVHSREEAQEWQRMTESHGHDRGHDDGECIELEEDLDSTGLVMEAGQECYDLFITGQYSEKDAEVCKRMHSILRSVQGFAEKFNDKKPASFLDQLLKPNQEQLVRYIGCLAMGDKNKLDAWRDLVSAPETREALVVGILGRALKEHVFSALWFGGTPEDVTKLVQMERDAVSSGDGFSRTRDRANVVQSYAQRDDATKADFGLKIGEICLQLEKLLAPFRTAKAQRLPEDLRTLLRDIVEAAARLSRLMRLVPDVVYFWSSVFKDEEFEPGRMECYNIKDMQQKSPYNKQDATPRSGANSDATQAIVKIVCFPSLVAYRKGGGGLAQQELAREKARSTQGRAAPPDVVNSHKKFGRGRPEGYTGEEGFRSKTICKSVVYLVWGRQRLLTREAGTSAHMDADKKGDMKKYEDDYEGSGYVELYDVWRERFGEKRAKKQRVR